MKTSDKTSTNESRYKIQGRQIFDEKKEIQNGKPVDIRELLDSSSHQYGTCQISSRERLDMIGSLGLRTLIPILEECFKSGNMDYNAENEATSTIYFLLCGVYPGLHPKLVENQSKTKPIIQLINYNSL
jgi:hypothetical protein